MTTGWLGSAYKAFNAASRTGLLLALGCFGFAWYSIFQGEFAHALMLFALASLLMDNIDAKPDE